MNNEKNKSDNQPVTLPNMNVNLALPEQAKDTEIVKSDQLIPLYNEILHDIRDDRTEIDEVLRTFLDMVTNEGDATTSSKEAVVNLLKLKSETADKKTRVMDLLLRAFLKEKDNGFPRYLAAKQENTINIEGSNKRKLLKSIMDTVEDKKGKD